MGISCVGFEDQFKALLVAIEAGRPLAMKSIPKKNWELEGLVCSINYDSKKGSIGRYRAKGL